MKYMAVTAAAVMGLLLWRVLYVTWPKRQPKPVRKIKDRNSENLSAQIEKCGMAEKMTTSTFRACQGMFGFGCFVAGFIFEFPIWLSLLAGAGGMFLPGFFLKLQIKRENRKMLPDIEHLYNLLHLQKEAGAFITDSLIDSYRVVTYWRLKKALIDLAGAIHNKKSIRQATEEFTNKFENPYLYTLADIIRHSVEDGNTDTMLQDVSEQIAGIQQAQYVIEEGKQEMESILWFTLLFIGIIAGILVMGIEAIQGSAGMLF